VHAAHDAPRQRVNLGPAPHVGPARSAASGQRSASGGQRRAASGRRAGPGHSGGLDLPWLAACLGLVAAACALGRPAGTRAAAVRGRDVFASLLKPLGGRG
jgi:hypothetical protein